MLQGVPPTPTWPTVAVYIVTMVCSSFCVVVPFWIISRNESLLGSLTQQNPTYLRGVTIILTVSWISALSFTGSMNDQVSTLFGVMLGYVFGAVNRKESPTPP